MDFTHWMNGPQATGKRKVRSPAYVCVDTTCAVCHSSAMQMSASGVPSEVLKKVTLSGLIQKSVKLEKAGREFKALCPFHKEATPSFYVNDEKGFYHCFGCGAHGDASTWLINQGSTKTQAREALYVLAGLKMPKGGAKLSRTETVTVRLDPQLNYLAELAARAQRRTKSSFIEWAVAESLSHIEVDIPHPRASGSPSIQELAASLWSVDEADRLVSLALTAPSLLSHEEQVLWRYIRENGYLWRGTYSSSGEWTWHPDEASLIKDRLRDTWDEFKAVASGNAPPEVLPSWSKTQVEHDVPF